MRCDAIQEQTEQKNKQGKKHIVKEKKKTKEE